MPEGIIVIIVTAVQGTKTQFEDTYKYGTWTCRKC